MIIESTVAPGTSSGVVKRILDKKKFRYALAHCPERAFPGRTLKEMIENYRVIGGLDQGSGEMAKRIYKTFVKGNIFLTDLTTAETVKLLENSYRDVNIAFDNEMAKLAHRIGINMWEAIRLANYHPRVNIHVPGPGVGGHCIPLDPWFLVDVARKESPLFKKSLLLNEQMPLFVAQLAADHVRKYGLKIKRFGILGVAYKKNVDDARETPALRLAEEFKRRGYEVRCADPYVKHFPHPLVKQDDLIRWADALVIVTDHDIYKEAKLSSENIKLVIDTRNMLSDRQRKALVGAHVILLGAGEEKITHGRA